MRLYGSVRGAISDGRPYRDSNPSTPNTLEEVANRDRGLTHSSPAGPCAPDLFRVIN